MERRLGTIRGSVRPYHPDRIVEEPCAGAEIGADQAALLPPDRNAAGKVGHDFSAVRVHSDSAAAASARARNAAAYAVGNHIVFGSGRYRADTQGGAYLLAHEIAHLLQQGSRGAQSVDCHEAKIHESIERHALTEGGVFSEEEASATYFGNWMRDMNQMMAPALTKIIPADVVFLLIGFMAAKKFGRELTPEQFGYYIPAEHLDNPAGLVKQDDLLPGQPAIASSIGPPLASRLTPPRPAQLDTPQQDVAPGTPALSGDKAAAKEKTIPATGGQKTDPAEAVDDKSLFTVDQAGMMAFLLRSVQHVERRLRLAVAAKRTPDGLQHFGAALHAIEDLFAHSNFVEIAVDKLLRQAPAKKGGKTEEFLPQLKESDRQVFTYASSFDVGHGKGKRPVLTTGTFSKGDTIISLGSELVGMLSAPLAQPASPQEEIAQDRLIMALLVKYEAMLRLHVEQALRAAGGALVASYLKLSLSTMFMATNSGIALVLGVNFVKNMFRALVSRYVLRPLANKIQSAVIEAKVADTSLTQVLRADQKELKKKGDVAAQEKAGTTVAARRSAALKATPAQVVAGPSHSQLAKDHPNSPFFGLGFKLAAEADKRLRDLMVKAWAEESPTGTKHFDFGPSHFPALAPTGASDADKEVYDAARVLYHGTSAARKKDDAKRLKLGNVIAETGGVPDQPAPNLVAMRDAAAHEMRTLAADLVAMAGAAETAQAAATRLLARAIPPGAPLLAQRIRALREPRKTASNQTASALEAVAIQLKILADKVAETRGHQQREALHAELTKRRHEALMALVGHASVSGGVAAAALYWLDRSIQVTAVAYSSEQRAILEGKATLPEQGPDAPQLKGSKVALPPVEGSGAVADLIKEARMLMNHPYENDWWEPHVRAFAKAHGDRLATDVEARNEGVVLYREGESHD